MSFCGIKNCGREIGTHNTGAAIRTGNMLVCESCHGKLEEVRAELPVAVMEFHAWAMIHGPFVGEDLGKAMDRVRELRKIQEWLKP